MDPLYQQPDMYAPLPKDYDERIKDPLYSNTWRYTDHPNLGNQTAYEIDAPQQILEVVKSADETTSLFQNGVPESEDNLSLNERDIVGDESSAVLLGDVDPEQFNGRHTRIQQRLSEILAQQEHQGPYEISGDSTQNEGRSLDRPGTMNVINPLRNGPYDQNGGLSKWQ